MYTSEQIGEVIKYQSKSFQAIMDSFIKDCKMCGEEKVALDEGGKQLKLCSLCEQMKHGE